MHVSMLFVLLLVIYFKAETHLLSPRVTGGILVYR